MSDGFSSSFSYDQSFRRSLRSSSSAPRDAKSVSSTTTKSTTPGLTRKNATLSEGTRVVRTRRLRPKTTAETTATETASTTAEVSKRHAGQNTFFRLLERRMIFTKQSVLTFRAVSSWAKTKRTRPQERQLSSPASRAQPKSNRFLFRQRNRLFTITFIPTFALAQIFILIEKSDLQKVVRTPKTTRATSSRHSTNESNSHNVENAFEMPQTKRKSRADIKKQRKLKEEQEKVLWSEYLSAMHQCSGIILRA